MLLLVEICPHWEPYYVGVVNKFYFIRHLLTYNDLWSSPKTELSLSLIGCIQTPYIRPAQTYKDIAFVRRCHKHTYSPTRTTHTLKYQHTIEAKMLAHNNTLTHLIIEITESSYFLILQIEEGFCFNVRNKDRIG